MSKVKEFTVTVSMQPSMSYNKSIVEVSATCVMEDEDDFKTEMKRMVKEIGNTAGPKAQDLVVWLADQAANQGRGA